MANRIQLIIGGTYLLDDKYIRLLSIDNSYFKIVEVEDQKEVGEPFKVKAVKFSRAIFIV